MMSSQQWRELQVIALYFRSNDKEVKLQSFEVAIALGAMEVKKRSQHMTEYEIGEIDTSIYELLEDAFTSAYQILRWRAVYTAGHLDLHRFGNNLIQIVSEDPDGNVRAAAAEALGEIGAKEALNPLIEVMRTDTTKVVFSRAMRAIAKMGDAGTLIVLRKNIKNFPEHRRPDVKRLIEVLESKANLDEI